MTAPIARRFTFKKPKTRADFIAHVERALGAKIGTGVDVSAVDGARVRVNVADVVRKFWDKYPERWKDVPLIAQTLHSAPSVLRSARIHNSRGYLVRLRPSPSKHETVLYATWVEGTGEDRTWTTTHRVDKPDYYRKVNAGDPVWPHQIARASSRRRNPAPSRLVSDASRPGRAPVTRTKSSTARRGTGGGWGLLALVSGTAGLAEWALRRR